MSSTFSTAVYIESPPSIVFEALTNLDAFGQWLPNFVRIEKLTGGLSALAPSGVKRGRCSAAKRASISA